MPSIGNSHHFCGQKPEKTVPIYISKQKKERMKKIDTKICHINILPAFCWWQNKYRQQPNTNQTMKVSVFMN